MDTPSPVRVDGTSVLLAVRVTPKGGRDAVDRVDVLGDGKAVLAVRVRAAPADGEANAALIALLARTFKIPRRDIAFHSGETSRVKILRIATSAEDMHRFLAPFIL